jgi:DUF4097 and DUF4098 domain-containing protein YvlB
MKRITIVAALAVVMGLFDTSAWADFKRERTLKLEPGGTFILESDIGDVVLTGESASSARVLITSDKDLDRDFDVSFDETARGVTVKIKQRGTLRRFFSGWSENDHTRITIHVPTRTDVRLSTSGGSVSVSRLTGVVDMRSSGGSLDVDAIDGNVNGGTSGGSIRMRDVHGNVIANTSGGSIIITDVRGSLRADTSGGGITIADVSGELRASTSGGGVDVRAAGGRVEASSSGGGVTVRFAPGNSSGGVVSSSGGSVHTEIDPGAKLSIDATASGGSVRSDVPVTIQGKVEQDSLRGDLNGGGALLRLRSSGGGVRIGANAQGQRANGNGQK